jgi:lipopolysaccharide transport system permease protein
MFHNLRQLFRYRALIQSLVNRELKARYRGSVLGFFWSFINPLLLLVVYSFVFTVVLPGQHPEELQPYALFPSAASCRGHGSPRRSPRPPTASWPAAT